MKYCIIVPDGAADYPVARLHGKTPLDAARTPNMDRAAAEGLLGVTCHIPHRMQAGSSVAIMSVSGYDPAREYTGRAPLEAADLGIPMGPDDWAVRCNLITTDGDTLADFTAGHISTDEAALLINALDEQLGGPEVSFHVGISYRHIMLYRGELDLGTATVPPHDVVGEPLADNLPRGRNADLLVELMRDSRAVLEDHEVNKVRLDLDSNPANMIWLWGQGRAPAFESFQQRFGLSGAVISAVNLVRGLGRLVGWDVIQVPGATGYTDTDYAAKGRYALDALMESDVVMVHVEAPDEASHDRDLQAKVRAIECVDRDIVGPIMAHPDLGGQLSVLVVPDHLTSVADGKHKSDPVPFAIWGPGVEEPSGRPFCEREALQTGVEITRGHELMPTFLGSEG